VLALAAASSLTVAAAAAALVDTVEPSAPARRIVGAAVVGSYGETPAAGVVMIAIVQVSFGIFTDSVRLINSQQKSILRCFPELPIPGLLLTGYLVEIYI
jgi:hypothetical protein